MQISPIRIVLGLLMLVSVACARTAMPPVDLRASESPAPSLSVRSTISSGLSSRPDLIIKSMYLEMEGRQGNCVTAYSPYGIRVQIKNIGSADAGPFFVDLNGIRQQVKNGLVVGQSVELQFAGTTPSGHYKATADAIEQVVESQEDNNSFSFIAPTPTPPPLCPATPTVIP